MNNKGAVSLYIVRIGDQLFLLSWKPQVENNSIVKPSEHGLSLLIPNLPDLSNISSLVSVRIIESEEDTGLYIAADSRYTYSLFVKEKPTLTLWGWQCVNSVENVIPVNSCCCEFELKPGEVKNIKFKL